MITLYILGVIITLFLNLPVVIVTLIISFVFRSQNMITLYILGVIIAILLNLLVVIVTIKKGSHANHLDFLMFSLSVSDIIRSSSGYPLEIYAALNTDVIDDMACTIAGFSITFLALVSISHLVGMSIERCIIMMFPWKARQWFSNRWISLFTILPSWIYGLIWATFPLIGWSSYQREQGAKHRCSINLVNQDYNARSYAIGLLVSCFVIPITGIAISSLLSLREMKKMTNQVGELGIDQEQSSVRRKAEVKHTIMSFVLIGVFLLTWAPYAACVFVMTSKGEVGDTLLSFSAIFAKTSTIYNPIIYFIFMKDFRKRILALFGLQQLQANSSRGESTMNSVSGKKRTERSTASES